MAKVELNPDITGDAVPIRHRAPDLIALVSLHFYSQGRVRAISNLVVTFVDLTKAYLRTMEDFKVRQLSLTADPGTDWWRKPPSINSENGPTHLMKVSTKDFHRARVTVSSNWTRLYDQGGLFIFFPKVVGTLEEPKRCWLKTGIEFFHEKPNVSIVSSREWSDWSLTAHDTQNVTIEVEREAIDVAKGLGSSLFVYTVVDGVRSETPIREVTWAFEEEGEMEVGVYAARPTSTGAGDVQGLEVQFHNFERE